MGYFKHIVFSSIVYFIVAFIVVVTLLPSMIPDQPELMPFIPLASVFFWSLVMPYWMPYWGIFLLGVGYDVFSGMPLGVTSILLCLLAFMATWQRRHLIIQPFWILWSLFALASITLTSIGWLFMCLYYWQVLPYQGVLWKVASSVAFYPVVHLAFAYLYRWLWRIYRSLERYYMKLL